MAQDQSVSIHILCDELAQALAADNGKTIRVGALSELLDAEAKAEGITLVDGAVLLEQMWLLYAGWKFRIGQAYDFLSEDRNLHDFWEVEMPKTRDVFSRLSKQVVAEIMRKTRDHTEATGTNLVEVFIESSSRSEPPEQTYRRVSHRKHGLKAVEQNQ